MENGDPTPLEFLQAVYCNPELPLNTRLRAATEAAKYVHPRMAVVAQVGEGFGDRLEAALKAAILRSANADAYEPPRVIEHQSIKRRV